MTVPALGLQLYTARHANVSLYELLVAVAAAGYDGVEAVGTQGVDPAALREALARAELALASAHVPLVDLRRDLAGVAAAHQALGTPLVVVPWLDPHERPTDATGWAALGRELDGLGRALQGEGLALAYHHHDFELSGPPGEEGLTVLADAADPDHLTLELDTGWLLASGHEPRRWLDAHGSRVTRLHLKDLEPGGDPPWVDVGDGVLELEAVLGAARSHGVPWVLVEHDAPSDALTTLRRSADAARRVLQRA